MAKCLLRHSRKKAKAAVKAVKKHPSTKHHADAVRHIDQALAVATNATQREALTDARTVLAAYFQLEGIKLPQRRGRKPGWRKTAQEAIAVATWGSAEG